MCQFSYVIFTLYRDAAGSLGSERCFGFLQVCEFPGVGAGPQVLFAFLKDDVSGDFGELFLHCFIVSIEMVRAD